MNPQTDHPVDRPSLFAGRSKGHWLTLAVAAGLVVGLSVLGLLLTPDTRGVGTHEQLGLRPCLPIQLWNVPCPGCGVTTSVTLATQGDFAASVRNQPFGFTVWLGLLAFLGWVVLGLVRRRDLGEQLVAWNKTPWLWAAGVIAGLSWVYKIWLMHGPGT